MSLFSDVLAYMHMFLGLIIWYWTTNHNFHSWERLTLLLSTVIHLAGEPCDISAIIMKCQLGVSLVRSCFSGHIDEFLILLH